MKVLVRYAVQFFAGVGMFALSNRVYWIVWDYYANKLPRAYEQYDFIVGRANLVMVVLFVTYQLLAYAGMRVVIRRPK